MTIAFFKFKCCLDENGDIYCKYAINFTESLYKEILELIEDTSPELPLNFKLCDVSGLPETWIEIFIQRNASTYEIIRGKDFIILI